MGVAVAGLCNSEHFDTSFHCSYNFSTHFPLSMACIWLLLANLPRPHQAIVLPDFLMNFACKLQYPAVFSIF